MADVEIKRTAVGEGQVLSPRGSIDLSCANELDRELATLLNAEPLPGFVVLDFEFVHFISSIGIAVLLAFGQRAAANDVPVTVARLGEQATMALRAMKMDRHFSLHATVAEAVEAARARRNAHGADDDCGGGA
jgi:anti-anti-sigma factor